MPIYAFECTGCKVAFDLMLPLAQYDAPQTCPTCGVNAQRVITAVGFVFSGDNWPGKALRVRRQMEEKNRKLDAKQRDRPAPIALVPNVEGERVETWLEARKLAASKGKNTSSYDPLVKRESGEV